LHFLPAWLSGYIVPVKRGIVKKRSRLTRCQPWSSSVQKRYLSIIAVRGENSGGCRCRYR
jgi:hypothetical protein